MKRFLFIGIFFLAAISNLQAQEIAPNAIGLRFGSSGGFGTEISYQHALHNDNRLEFDLGWQSDNYWDAYRLTGLYQWVKNIDGSFNWYLGVGAGLGSYSFDTDDSRFNGDSDSEFFVFGAGDIGIEYSFDFPLMLSLDFRPELGFDDYRDNLSLDIALSARYQF